MIKNSLPSSASYLIAGMKQVNNVRVQRRCGAFFIHVPKNAGTSISKAVYGKQLSHWTLRDYISYQEDLPRIYPFFAILRDPVDRFLSAYTFLSKNGTEEVGVKSFERPDKRSLGTPLALSRYLQEKETATLHPALKSQFHYISDYNGRIDKVTLFRQDQFNKIASFLQSFRLTSTSGIPKINQTGRNYCNPEELDEIRSNLEKVYPIDFKLFQESGT